MTKNSKIAGIEGGADLVQTIKSQFGQLSPQLQIAARYIISAPEDVAIYSMREIATRAQVKPSTMVRLAGRFGHENYNTFRDDFRKRISAPMTGYAARARALQHRQSNGNPSGLLTDILEAEQENIQAILSHMSEEQLKQAAEACLAAEKIYVVGLRKCFPIAYFFHYATRVFFPGSTLIQGQAGLFREEISQIGKHDLVLAIAFEPYTRETVDTVQMAHTLGSKVIAITDSIVSPLAQDADFTFIAPNRSPSFYRSLTGAMTIVQALVAAIVTQIGESAVKALDKMDANLRSNNTYWYN